MTPPSISRSLPVMKPAVGPSRKAATSAISSGGAMRLEGDASTMARKMWPISDSSAWRAQRGGDYAGADGIDAGAALAPVDRLGLHAQGIGALCGHIGDQNIRACSPCSGNGRIWPR